MLCTMRKCYLAYHVSASQQKVEEPSKSTAKPIECTKVQIRLEQSELSEALQEHLNEFILTKKLEEAVLRRHYGIRQTKDCQSINLESNKVGVVSLTKFYNFLKIY